MVEVAKATTILSNSSWEAGLLLYLQETRVHLDKIPVKAVTKFETELMAFLDAKYSNILEAIRTDKRLTDDTWKGTNLKH